MYLLSGQSLTRADWFRPEKMALNLEERNSTATITLGTDAPEIQAGAWLLDETEPGAGIIWRAKTDNEQFDTDTRTVALEHIAATLKGRIMFGQVKPTDMRASGSTAPARKCYAAEAIDYILSYTGLWTRGTIDSAFSSVSNPYNFNGDSLFAALETVTASLPGCYWEFDLSAIPFRINFLKLSDEVDSEMRMDRNITTMRRTVDISRMYTRFYPIGKNDLHIPGNYVSRNESTYGVIEKVETDQSKTTVEELTAWANERLDKHAEPSVTVTISGMELSERTGEPLDHFVINKKCRMPLPKYGTVIKEKVTKLSWSDKISAPEAVTVTLANLIEDLASIINNANAASSRGGRTAAKDAKEDHAWFEDTTDHVAMIAEAVAGEGAASDWSRVASIVVDGDGIHQRVTAAEAGVVTATSWIEQNETSILQGVQDATGAKSWINQYGSTVTAGVAKISSLEAKDVELEGRLDIEAGKASLLVSATDAREILTYQNLASFPETGDPNKLYYSLANKKYYEWKNGAYSETTPGNTINRAGIIATINQDGTSTTSILGNKVLIGFNDEQLTDEDLNSWAADAKNGTGVFAKFLTVKRLTAQEISTMLANIGDATIEDIEVGTVSAEVVTVEEGLTTGSLVTEEINECSIDNFIADATVSGNTLILTKVSGEPITFSKASSATKTGSWGGSVPDEYTVTVTDGDGTWTRSIGFRQSSDVILSVLNNGAATRVTGTKNATVPVKVTTTEQGATTTTTVRYTGNVTADCSELYNAGWGAAYAKVSIPSSSAYGSSITVSTPPSTVDGTADSTQFDLSVDKNYAYILKHGNSMTLARVNNPQYGNGWAAAYAKVSIPSSSAYGSSITVSTPPSTVDGTADSTQFDLVVDNNYAYIQKHGNQMTLARVANTAYETGWKDGWRAYYDDAIDWYPSSQHPNWTGKAWIPKRNADLYYSRGGHGDGSSTYCEEWSAVETPSGGGSSANYSVSFNSAGTFSSGETINNALSGWNPQLISGVPNSQNQTFRYIKFTVDGVKRSFYFT